ncbi:hypothetical protein MRB53_040247 [Persea americana]|nr:hypothetical protein MRB53_040247 [Persea americana]
MGYSLQTKVRVHKDSVAPGYVSGSRPMRPATLEVLVLCSRTWLPSPALSMAAQSASVVSPRCNCELR